MTRMYIAGRGYWAPGCPTLEAWLANDIAPELARPEVGGVSLRLLRGASRVTRMCVEVMMRAAREAGIDSHSVPIITGSAHGELHTAVRQLQMMREEDGTISPASFRNSVHNTAAGILSIATENRGFATAVAAGPCTAAMCLVEAAGLLATGAEGVLVGLADDSIPSPLDTQVVCEPQAAAVLLTRSPPANGYGRLDGPIAAIGDGSLIEEPHTRGAAAVLAAILAYRGASGRLQLTPEGSPPWSVDVSQAS